MIYYYFKIDVSSSLLHYYLNSEQEVSLICTCTTTTYTICMYWHNEGACSGLTCQGSGLTGQARSLACQAGLTGRLAFGSPAANQALIHQLICYSESRAKSMTDLTVKSIENLLENHIEITQCIFYQFDYFTNQL